MKRKLAVILAATMMLNSFTVPAFAEDYADVVAVEDDGNSEDVADVDEYADFDVDENADDAAFFDDSEFVVEEADATGEGFEEVAVEETAVEDAEEVAADSQDTVQYTYWLEQGEVFEGKPDGIDWRFYPNDAKPVKAAFTLVQYDKDGNKTGETENYLVDATGTYKAVMFNDNKVTLGKSAFGYVSKPSVSLAGLTFNDKPIATSQIKSIKGEKIEGGKISPESFEIGDTDTETLSIYAESGDDVDFNNKALTVSDLEVVKDVIYPTMNGDCETPVKANLADYYVLEKGNLKDGFEPAAATPVLGYKFASNDYEVKVPHYFVKDSTFLVAAYDFTGADYTIENGAYIFEGEVTDEDQEEFFFSESQKNNTKIVDNEAQLINEDFSGTYYSVTREYCTYNHNATCYKIVKKTIDRYVNTDHYSTFENIKGYLKQDDEGNWSFVPVSEKSVVRLENLDPARTDLIVLTDCTKKGSFKQYTTDTTRTKNYVTDVFEVPAHNAKVTIVLAKKEDVAQNKILTATIGSTKFTAYPVDGAKLSNVTGFDASDNEKWAGFWMPEEEAKNLVVKSNVCYEDVEYRLATFCANTPVATKGEKCNFKATASDLLKAERGTNHVFDVPSRNRLKDTTLTPVIAGKAPKAKLVGYGYGRRIDAHKYTTKENVIKTYYEFDYYIELDANDPTVGTIYQMNSDFLITQSADDQVKFYNNTRKKIGAVKLGESTATCLENGNMDVTPLCIMCNAEMDVINAKVNKHTEQPGEPTRRILEDSTCDKEGTAVVETKCVICNRVLKSTEEVIRRKPHTFGDVSASITGNDVVIARQATDRALGTEHEDLQDAFDEYKEFGEKADGAYRVIFVPNKPSEVAIGRTNYEVKAAASWECVDCGQKLWEVDFPDHSSVVDRDAAKKAFDDKEMSCAMFVYITDLQKESADSREAGSITIKIVAYGYDKDGNITTAEQEVTKPYFSDWLAYLDRVNPEEKEKLLKAQEAAEKAAALAKENPTSININSAENAIIAAKAIGADTTKAEEDLKAAKVAEEAARKATEEALKKAAEEAAKKAAEEQAKAKAAEEAKNKVKTAAESVANDALTAANAALSNPTDASVKVAKDAVTAANASINTAKAAGADTTAAAKTVALANTAIAAAQKQVKAAVPTITFGNSKVRKALVPGGHITNRIILKKGQTLKIKAKASDGSKVYYRAINDKLISCSKSGKVKAKKVGRTRVIVTTKNGAKYEVLFRVKK